MPPEKVFPLANTVPSDPVSVPFEAALTIE